MQLEELPLLEIFNSLRQRHGLPLGVDDYLVVLRSLQAGFGISNHQELKQLCCLVWAKSEEENRLIQRLFKQMWQHIQQVTTSKSDYAAKSTSNLPQPENISASSTETSEPSSTDELSPELETSSSLTPEPVQAVQAVRSSWRDRELKRPRYSLLTEYFPVTRREMKQIWRYLRRPVREGVPIELDVEATVAKIGREGFLLKPVLMPPRSNRTDLVLLIDQEGSMVPFHGLSRQLVETAQWGGRLRETRIFYFHDYPDEYLYRHPAFLDAQPISEILEEIGERTTVLIVSDGGAARGNFDQERVDSTKVWIKQLQQSVRYFAWLNPMPSECWQHTTAGEIARFVPMFEMSHQGMNAAIGVLRGRYVVDRQDNLQETVLVDSNASNLQYRKNDNLLQKGEQNLHQLESSVEPLTVVNSPQSLKNQEIINSNNQIEGELELIIYDLLFQQMRQSTKSSERDCRGVAMRITNEVHKICNSSKRIQTSGAVESWAITLAQHRLQKCLRYYQLGSAQGRKELHSTLSTIIYRRLNPSLKELSSQEQQTMIEDFLQCFYLEAINALRRENQLDPSYSPRTMLELVEYMAFAERYAKRRIGLPGSQQQLIIIMRAQAFFQQQSFETSVDVEQAAEGSSEEGEVTLEDLALVRFLCSA